MEVGGQRIGPTQDRLAALADEMGVDNLPHLRRGGDVFEWRGRLRRYKGTIPRINPIALIDIEAHSGSSTGWQDVPLEAPWAAPAAQSWTGRRPTPGCGATCAPGGRALLELGTEAVWAAQPEDISLLHMLFYIHSAG